MAAWLKETAFVPARLAMEGGLEMRIDYLHDLENPVLTQLKILLDGAYSDRTMHDFFALNLHNPHPMLVFTLWDKDEILAVRGVGPVEWGEHNRLMEEHARLFGQDLPIVGCTYTLRRDKRGGGLGTSFWERSMEWVRENAPIGVLFGDTISPRAFGMYARRGAWFYVPHVETLYTHYGVSDFTAFAAKTRDVEHFPDEFELLYAWPFAPSAEDKLAALGYEKVQ